MSKQTVSERLFAGFCDTNGVRYSRVIPGVGRSPDFVITLGGVEVTCEVKQIDPNAEDLKELAELRQTGSAGRFVANRLRGKLKDVSAQLKKASRAGHPTLLVVYDNTPFKTYSDHADVVRAMFGRHSVTVLVPDDPSLPTAALAPFLGADRGIGPAHNTAVSAVAILDGSLDRAAALRVYHNPHTAVRLDPALFKGLPVSQPVLPDATEVSL